MSKHGFIPVLAATAAYKDCRWEWSRAFRYGEGSSESDAFCQRREGYVLLGIRKRRLGCLGALYRDDGRIGQRDGDGKGCSPLFPASGYDLATVIQCAGKQSINSRKVELDRLVRDCDIPNRKSICALIRAVHGSRELAS